MCCTPASQTVFRAGFGFTRPLQRNLSQSATNDRLVYYETFEDPNDAIAREKEIKAWRREKKNELVEMLNPKWDDLRTHLFEGP